MSDDVAAALTVLREAIQAFINAKPDTDGPNLLSEAVVVYECVSYTQDGAAGRQISYVIPTDNFSLSGALGLLDAGRFYVRRAVLTDIDDDE